MIGNTEIQSALRTYLKTLSVCEATEVDEVTPLTLGATANGYTRTDGGSFLTDGFKKGMEVLGAGFSASANNGSKMITAVSESLLSCAGCVTEAASEGPSLEVGLPSTRMWENVGGSRTVGVSHVEEEFLPGPSSADAAPNDVEKRPMYIVKVLVPARTDIDADGAYADAIIQHFQPKVNITIGSHHLRGRADQVAYAGQRNNAIPGFSMIPVTIPLRIRTQITP